MAFKTFPQSIIYNQFFQYSPWGLLIEKVTEEIIKNAPANAVLLDAMCGPGFLSSLIKKRRPDISIDAVDINGEFIEFAINNYKNINFIHADILNIDLKKSYNIVVCTGGMHHLNSNEQELFLNIISNYLTNDSFAIIGDPYIRNFSTEVGRKLASAELGYAYLIYTIAAQPEDTLLTATIDILYNDVLGTEFKSSLRRNHELFECYFEIDEVIKTFPGNETDFGDYYFKLSKKYNKN